MRTRLRATCALNRLSPYSSLSVFVSVRVQLLKPKHVEMSRTRFSSLLFKHGMLLFLCVLVCGCGADGDKENNTITGIGLDSNGVSFKVQFGKSTGNLSTQCLSVDHNPLYAYRTRNRSLACDHVTVQSQSLPPRSVCDINKGCKPRLQCRNLTKVNDSRASTILNQQRVVKINASQLQYLLDSPKFTNMCMVVLFYANWCQYSVEFAPTYNLLGQSFTKIPFLAIDYGEQDP